MNNYGFLGVVQNGIFTTLAAEHDATGVFRLTSISLQEAASPESGEVSLDAYESSAIMVRGIDNGEWIYSAVVVDQAGPILTAVVHQVFNSTDTHGKYRLPFP